MKVKKEISFTSKIRNYFKVDERSSVIKKEIIGGLSTFFAMAYILAVNPAIVSNAKQGYEGGLFLAVAISAFVATMFMGLYANIPVALAPGMGMNAFFAFTIASQIGFESALTVTIISGVLYFIIVMTPLRKKMVELIPNNFKLSIGVGIGLFIAYLGMQNAGIVVRDNPLVSKIGDFNNGYVLFAISMLLLALLLHYLKVPGGILISMIVGAIVLAIVMSTNSLDYIKHEGVTYHISGFKLVGEYGDFGTFQNVVKSGWIGFANEKMWTNPTTYIGILSFLYMDFFDTTGTLLAINKNIELEKTDEKWFEKANIVDSVSTIFGGAIGSTTVTSYVESTVGASIGAKTGIASVITALCFALSIAAYPLIQIFMPINLVNDSGNLISFQPITGPILIVIGSLMIAQLKYFDWSKTIDIPVMMITISFMIFSNSIGSGISYGAITFMALYGAIYCVDFTKKLINKSKNNTNQTEGKIPNDKTSKVGSELNWIMILIALFSILYIVINTIFSN